MEFFHTSMCYISAITETYRFKFTPVTHGNMVNSKHINDLEMSRSMSNISITIKITFLDITLKPEVRTDYLLVAKMSLNK